jgi:MFS transporter, MHS family, proline/betaine transporter
MEKVMSANGIGAGAGNRRIWRRAILSASLGNSFEWYDFTVYALFSIYIAGEFFPGGGATAELVKAFLAFGVGFVVRPLGALALGLYADRAGRKAVLSLALSLMVGGTAILALAPGYTAIGVGAPFLILAGRMLQGFSAGGEFGGAAAYLLESAPQARRGEFSSWLQASMGLSNIMGALAAFLVTWLFTPDEVRHFAWRLPFVFGLLIAPIGLWMRRSMEETDEFNQRRRLRPSGRPLFEDFTTLMRDSGPALAKGVGLSTLITVSSYVLVIFMPIYVQRTFHYVPSQAFAASVIGNLFLVAACVTSGVLSDRVGRRPVLLAATLVLSACAFPLLGGLHRSPTFLNLVFVQSCFCIATGAFTGAAPAALSAGFPVQSRALGVSISYNVAVTLFSGFAPAALTWISARGGGPLTPAWYLAFAAALALPAVLAS